MTRLTEDDILQQLEAQDTLSSFMSTTNNMLMEGIHKFLPSLFVNNDEEILEYAVKPLLARSGPLDDINVSLRLIYALGKIDKWLYSDIISFSQFHEYLSEQNNDVDFLSDMTWDFVCNINAITNNEILFSGLKRIKFADFAIYSDIRFIQMLKTTLTLAVTEILQELNP
ncbi:MltR family transcriptional regulator [Providencia burhodogranariea]|uniref:Putative DNA-binding transcriptional regulator n=1 Tax=Providencia burhodogranariea DSM 19968 TaxID=1141662 RepID=K8W6B2_9GAMM|nr:putative DNA-binding transcriptional regulator [Providencia burhodogranariea DSM 19968]